MAITNGRFYLVKSFETIAVRLFGVGVIGMQVRQVAKMPLEHFVKGQMCLSTSEPISHSKVWHHVKLPPNHSCVMCFTLHISGSISSVLFPLISFLADGHFLADRIRPHCAKQCLL